MQKVQLCITVSSSMMSNYFVKRRCSSHISDFQLPKEIRDDYDFPKQMYTIWGTTFSLLPTRTNTANFLIAIFSSHF